MKILKSCKKQVEIFKAIHKRYQEEKKKIDKEKHVDLSFEYQAFMTDRIEDAKKQMADENGFLFYGEEAHLQVGHITNMANQLRAVLYTVRLETLGALEDHHIDELRKCPHCGEIWNKVGK